MQFMLIRANTNKNRKEDIPKSNVEIYTHVYMKIGRN